MYVQNVIFRVHNSKFEYKMQFNDGPRIKYAMRIDTAIFEELKIRQVFASQRCSQVLKSQWAECGGHNLAPLVEIGLTEIPNSGWTKAHQAHPLTTSLHRHPILALVLFIVYFFFKCNHIFVLRFSTIPKYSSILIFLLSINLLIRDWILEL